MGLDLVFAIFVVEVWFAAVGCCVLDLQAWLSA